MTFNFHIEELIRIYKAYFKEQNNHFMIKQWPSKFKNQCAVLYRIHTLFNEQQTYTEKEINIILKPIYEDHVMLRRYLVDLGALKRADDGSVYTKGFMHIVTINEN